MWGVLRDAFFQPALEEAFECAHGEENILRQKVEIHPLFPVVDTLCYYTLL